MLRSKTYPQAYLEYVLPGRPETGNTPLLGCLPVSFWYRTPSPRIMRCVVISRIYHNLLVCIFLYVLIWDLFEDTVIAVNNRYDPFIDIVRLLN